MELGWAGRMAVVRSGMRVVGGQGPRDRGYRQAAHSVSPLGTLETAETEAETFYSATLVRIPFLSSRFSSLCVLMVSLYGLPMALHLVCRPFIPACTIYFLPHCFIL